MPGEGIAIVGMACRYPDAKTPAELWENALARRRAFRRIPAERLSLEDYRSAFPGDPDSLYATEAAVLEGWEFDRVRFRVAGSTYRASDLTHWLALDVAAQALADAGFPEGDGLPKEATGVLLGNSLTGEFSRASLLRLRWPYVRRMVAASLAAEGWDEERAAAFLSRLEETYKAPFPAPMEETLAGGLSNTIAGRICNHFDLHGGGYTLDGACSSSLLAVVNACTALAAGDLDAALAGGVDLSLDPFELVGFARTGALTPGEMRVFDARSQGFIPGEGCGFVVLMREREAVSRGCRVYAVIRGWGISSDGHGGISRPEPQGQKLALSRAYRRAGFGVETIGYFEGHGTGTAVGDAAELQALTEALREAGATAPAAPVGSVKANIGHTKAAAGAAALLKATMAVYTQILPPNTGCEEPHPALTGEAAALCIAERGTVWPADRPLRAAASSMGFGGINTHVVIEGVATTRRLALSAREREILSSSQDAEILLLAAGDADRLAAEVERLAALAPRLSRAEVGDLAAELHRASSGGPARAAVVATHPRELSERLGTLLRWLREGVTGRIEPRHGLFLGVGPLPRRIGFLFPGQGSPSHLGGGALARRFEEAAEIHILAGLPPGADPVDTAVAQPAILANALAGLRLLDRLGLRAAVALGHSLGEIAALSWAGAFDAGDTLRIAALRGRAMADLPGDGGSMASLAADPATVAGILDGLAASVAAWNSPRRTVISGETPAVLAAIERARDLGLEATRLRVSHAFHSPLVAPVAPRLAEGLAEIPTRPLARAVVSTVTGALLDPGTDLPELLQLQVTSPVRFAEALEAARPLADLWIEVGPGHALSGLAREALDLPVIPLDAGGSSLSGLLHAAGAAFALGVPVDTAVLFEGRFTRPFPDRPLRFLANPCEAAPVLAFRGKDERDSKDSRDWGDGAFPLSPKGVGDGPGPGVRALLRQLVAERAELPPEAVGDDSRLLSDLHLNSISVGQLVAEAARRLGLRPPASPTDYAQATVAEVAQALEEQAEIAPAGVEEAEALPAGVDAWVRPFVVELVARPLPRRRGADAESPERGWKVIAPFDHPLAEALSAGLPGQGVALCLPEAPGPEHAGLFLEAARAVLAAPARLLVVQQGGGGGGFARTLHLEHPDVTVAVVDLPLGHPEAAAWAVAEAGAAQGYAEARYDTEGVRRVPVLRLLPPPEGAGPLPLGPDDVLLVTGGGKGIAAECALDLALATGARLALLGRSLPESDAELAGNLERMRAAGATALYVPADVTDPEAVRAAVDRAQAGLGPVTALLHGAGTNAPRLLASLDEAAFLRTLAPKVTGLGNVLAALDPGRLRLLVTFGSIISRAGLPGEADYATANEWQTLATERFAAGHPECRCLALEWSVWSGVGMGERLGTLEGLLRRGITPIPPGTGIELLHGLLARPLPAVAVVVTGRFGDPPTVELDRPEMPLLRFLETPRVHVPGVELVVDTGISADTDPYLADHVLRGEPLFAAVLGLEAMAQAALALTGETRLPVFEDVTFHRPVAVPPGRAVTIRVAALVREPGRVDVVLRESSTGFAADCFRAVCRFGSEEKAAPRLILGPDGAPLSLDPARDLYGPVLFHRGRFCRLQGYRQLRATFCLAEIQPDGAIPWFGRYLPDRLLLGDPGARDAAIHGIQACIPHFTLLPTGVDRVVTARLANDAPLLFAARERSRSGDDFVYDVEIQGADGRLLERWEGLRLRAVDRVAPPPSWSSALLAPYLERKLQEILPGSGLRVAFESAQNGSARRHRPDGRPETDNGGQLSFSHAGELVLAVEREGTVGCDLEPVASRTPAVWRDLLGAERYALAELIAREQGEAPDSAATRVWAAAESLKKAGAPHGAPLTLDTTREDGWLLFRSGDFRIGTLLTSVRELAGDAALAVLVEAGR
ncbi:MAG TPA: type I polyketide synthase [Thermoanaerobaculia bacterium]|nr:type I polyketide synthase [Thermoanaerobaculia bacterium]